MRSLYILSSYVYGFILSIASLIGHTKARKIVKGRQQTHKLQNSDFPPAPIWVHVSSLGEYQQVKPILQHIKSKSQHPVVLSFYSPSGYDSVQDENLYDQKIYLPLDVPHKMRHLTQSLAPHALILSRYDIWPILHETLDKVGTPIYLFSAHFRPSQIYFKPVGSFFIKALQKISHVCVQDHASQKLLQQVYPSEKITLGGDLRVRAIQDDASKAKKIPAIHTFLGGEKCLIAASVYPHEIKMILDAWSDLPYKIIIVPHDVNPKNIASIKSKLADYSYTCYTTGVDKSQDILLLDTIGLLRSAYTYSCLVYVGGGFGKGIHNIVEPAVHHNRIVHGPKSQAFPEAQLLENLGTSKTLMKKSDLKEASLDLLQLNDEEVAVANRAFFRKQQELHRASYDFLANLDFMTS